MDVVTGAFGYIGKYIAKALLEQGPAVRTITTHPQKLNPFGPAVQAFPYSFDDPRSLVRALQGARTLYNTYWIRFPYQGQTYKSALANTRILFDCARQANVERIVHISVTRPPQSRIYLTTTARESRKTSSRNVVWPTRSSARRWFLGRKTSW